MAEYISRNDLLNAINTNVAEAHNERCSQLLEAILNAPTADVEEKKDCEECIHFGKHATEYPCSHCRNCYTDKFQTNDTRTPKERGGEK